ncbi:hypothetical protein LCGC14_2860700 [marine sediment metagenome]|uniref:Uncharacterized protein n=1 Tax=marine sediment metagenome TaxID=412755 RepID=A0A0F8Y5Z6_9ZZZZ
MKPTYRERLRAVDELEGTIIVGDRVEVTTWHETTCYTNYPAIVLRVNSKSFSVKTDHYDRINIPNRSNKKWKWGKRITSKL